MSDQIWVAGQFVGWRQNFNVELEGSPAYSSQPSYTSQPSYASQPPYLPTSYYTQPPAAYEKQVVGMETAMNGSRLSDDEYCVKISGSGGKRICGIRRQNSWIVIYILCVVLLLAALGIGLGVGLSKKYNGSGKKSTGGGLNTSSSTPTLSTQTNSNGVKIITVQVTTSVITTDDGDDETYAPFLELETGVHTVCLTYSSTTGASNICTNLLNGLPTVTTIFPTITGDPDSFYTASWSLTGYPSTITAIGSPPQETGMGWYFQIPAVETIVGDCSLEVRDAFIIASSGNATYLSNFASRNKCDLPNQSLAAGDSCELILSGRDYNESYTSTTKSTSTILN
ncbi:hypothetical protein TWF694_008065 [Orbilia ellipsospora]|uniref:LysM domain-containing protein n=1 Tax=Orbilia ellipsospora TaxID=2528407 RepID=A0AAV9XGD5_9PEZI